LRGPAFFFAERAGFCVVGSGRSELNIARATFHDPSACLRLLSQALGGAGVRDGILGIDAFAGGFRLDFRAMQFSPK